MRVPEPEGMHMQLIKGFSDLNYNFLRPQLPDPLTRKTIDIYWPEWNGEDGWEMYWNVGPRQLVQLHVQPCGLAILTTFEKAPCNSHAYAYSFPLRDPQKPLEDVFIQIGFIWHERMITCLIEGSKKED